MHKEQCRWRKLDKQRPGIPDACVGVGKYSSKWGFLWLSPAIAVDVFKMKIANGHVYNTLWGQVLNFQSLN